MKKRNIEGERFGSLVALHKIGNHKYPSGLSTEIWSCKCDCGRTADVFRKNLLNGNTKSCGCTKGRSHTTHGGKGTKIYNVWISMRARCQNVNSRDYKYYGAKGITVCDSWNSDFDSFRRWAYENGYADGLTLDRISVYKGYGPDNCRWVDMRIQSNNRSNSIYITYSGETHTCSEWSRITGINYDTLHNRVKKGMSIEDIFSIQKHKTGPKNKPTNS